MSKSLEEIQADKELEVIMSNIDKQSKIDVGRWKLYLDLDFIDHRIVWDGVMRGPMSDTPAEDCRRFRPTDPIWFKRKEAKLKEIQEYEEKHKGLTNATR